MNFFSMDLYKANLVMNNVVKSFIFNEKGEINIISMVLIIIVVIALVAIFETQMTGIVNAMFDKIRTSMGLATGGT